jgi:hypothetical protein
MWASGRREAAAVPHVQGVTPSCVRIVGASRCPFLPQSALVFRKRPQNPRYSSREGTRRCTTEAHRPFVARTRLPPLPEQAALRPDKHHKKVGGQKKPPVKVASSRRQSNSFDQCVYLVRWASSIAAPGRRSRRPPPPPRPISGPFFISGWAVTAAAAQHARAAAGV